MKDKMFRDIIMSKSSSNSSTGKSGNTIQISPSKHWVFTLNNHTENDINFLMDCSSIEQLSMQEETGENGTPHLQGYLKFVTKKRPLSIFGNVFKAHWEKCKHVCSAIEYTQKAETRTGKQFVKGLRIVRPLKCLKKEQLYDWQTSVVSIIEQEPDDRTIHWYWEDIGNVGKSALVRYLVLKHNALLVSGRGQDIKFLISQQAQPPDIIIYDIPRTAENYVNYTALEEIKNGVFCSSKYESKMCVINPPHIICFANFEPFLEAVSADRWCVTNLC
ncbi:MAG: putative viral replication protein [Cressdnaviricota sp.]|nr:MAG: putative viral replication protein [Cressdnaviricota sp.]